MSRFLITGLPRSRTAWFAVLTGAAHEPTARMAEYGDLFGYWKHGQGISDSGLGLWLGRVLEDFAPRTLVIERDAKDVLRSFMEYLPTANAFAAGWYIAEAEKVLVAHRGDPLVKTVRFDALDDQKVVHDCLAWLTPERNYPQLEQMMHMKVEVTQSYLASLLTRASEAGRWVANA